MAQVITSFTPTTGPANGGTVVVITGTGLDVTDRVFVGDGEGQIISHTGSTGLTFRAPSGTAGTAKITVLDTTAGAGAAVVSSGDYTYSAAVGQNLVGTLNRDWQVDVYNTGSTTWVGVYGMTQMQPAVDNTDQDDSDMSSNGWGATLTTMRHWNLPCTVSRKKDTGTLLPDPGQEYLRAAADSNTPVSVRWYKKIAGWEAYSGTGIVQWSPQGGAVDGIDFVAVTIKGQGARSSITNPFGA